MQRLSIARSLRLALVGLTVALAVVAAVGVASLYTSRQHYEDKLVDSASLATAAANLASAGVTEEEVLRDARGPGAAAARSQAAATFAAAARNVDVARAGRSRQHAPRASSDRRRDAGPATCGTGPLLARDGAVRPPCPGAFAGQSAPGAPAGPPGDSPCRRTVVVATGAAARGDRRRARDRRRAGAGCRTGPRDAGAARRPREGDARLGVGSPRASREAGGTAGAAGAREGVQRDGRRAGGRLPAARGRAATARSDGRQPRGRADRHRAGLGEDRHRQPARGRAPARAGGRRRRRRRRQSPPSRRGGAAWGDRDRAQRPRPGGHRGPTGQRVRRRGVDRPRHQRARQAGAGQERVRRDGLARAAQPADVDQGIRRAAGALVGEHVRATARVRRDHPQVDRPPRRPGQRPARRGANRGRSRGDQPPPDRRRRGRQGGRRADRAAGRREAPAARRLRRPQPAVGARRSGAGSPDRGEPRYQRPPVHAGGRADPRRRRARSCLGADRRRGLGSGHDARGGLARVRPVLPGTQGLHAGDRPGPVDRQVPGGAAPGTGGRRERARPRQHVPGAAAGGGHRHRDRARRSTRSAAAACWSSTTSPRSPS